MKILVTGGASGIGHAVSRRLLGDAENVVYFTYCSSARAAQALEREFENAHAVHCDFKDRTSLQLIYDSIENWSIQGLVNNAVTGVRRAHFHKASIATCQESFEHDVLPVLGITQVAISYFRKQRFGRIVTVLTSALVNRAPVGMSVYVAGKAYLASMAKSWAIENASFGITSNSISPSAVRTALTTEVDERQLESLIESHPLKRLLTAEEVADAVSFLLTASPHVNGVNLIINAAENVV